MTRPHLESTNRGVISRVTSITETDQELFKTTDVGHVSLQRVGPRGLRKSGYNPLFYINSEGKLLLAVIAVGVAAATVAVVDEARRRHVELE